VREARGEVEIGAGYGVVGERMGQKRDGSWWGRSGLGLARERRVRRSRGDWKRTGRLEYEEWGQEEPAGGVGKKRGYEGKAALRIPLGNELGRKERRVGWFGGKRGGANQS
jgi:hypothetical protein